MIKLPSHASHLLQIALLSVFFATIGLLSFWLKPEKAAYSKSITKDQTISVHIGTPIATIYGYTCPHCEVHLTTSTNTDLQTQSRADGYFEFTRIFTTVQNPDLCLSSIDSENRNSHPVCIPPPDPNLTEPIGPILLSPTVTISKGSFLTNETVEAKGQSIPNSEVSVSLFRAEPTIWERFQVQAALLPSYTIKTDHNGNYSFNLPSNSSNKFRLFIQTIFNTSQSPKSNTLTFRILNSWEYAIQNLMLSLKLLLNLLRQIPLLNIIILVQLLILLYLAYRYIVNKRPHRELMVIHNDIVDYSKDKKLMLNNNF